MAGLKERAAHEIRIFVAIFAYTYVVLALFNLHEYIVLREHHIEFTRYGFALFNAFVLAKIVLIAENRRLGAGLERHPLVYHVLGKSVLFAAVLIGFHVVERVIGGMIHGHSVADSVPSIGGGGVAGIVAAGIIVSVTMIPFFAARAIMEMLGSPSLYSLLFSRRADGAARFGKTARSTNID
ncbi:MAG TPA: hypothetical protein VIJ52_02855 [Pseudolabrys sp.]